MGTPKSTSTLQAAVDLAGSTAHGPAATDGQAVGSADAMLAAIVAASQDAILSKSMDGAITSWNHAAEKMFGYTAEEVIGRPIALIIPPERQSEENEVLTRIRRGEWIEHYDTVRVRKDGRRLDISLSVSALRDAQGQVSGASNVARDVSDRKREERERSVLLAEAQAANRAKDDFLAMLGHELRSPLAAISGASQALELASDLEETRRPREVIDRQLTRLAQLVDDLLDAAQIQAGKIRLQLNRLRLSDVVQRSVAAVPTGAHTVTVETDDAVLISGDLNRLQQIFYNLIVNAVQYTPKGRSIRIRGFGEGDEAVVQISDEGSGIAPETLPRIFDLFMQGQRNMDRTQGGLGIGLTLAKKLVELHGGTLTAASAGVGMGSVFTARIPRLPVESAPAVVSAPALDTRRVLVVEDNEDTREMFKMVLQLKGHDVLEAADGAEAVEVALRDQPEIAFIDIGLPILDGYEVARQIRRKLGSKILLIAVTGYGQPEDEACALRAGFDEHAVKPLPPSRLAEILRRSL